VYSGEKNIEDGGGEYREGGGSTICWQNRDLENYGECRPNVQVSCHHAVHAAARHAVRWVVKEEE